MNNKINKNNYLQVKTNNYLQKIKQLFTNKTNNNLQQKRKAKLNKGINKYYRNYILCTTYSILGLTL